MDENRLLAERAEKDQFFKQSEQSPLTPEQQDRFAGLRYYPPNPALDLIVAVERAHDNQPAAIDTTTGDVRQYDRYGTFTFTVNGEAVALTIYEAPYGYFLPFTDANRGGDTYGAGRYLEPEELPDGRFHVDFNIAYNPYCAYNDGWSCPITPFENRLSVAIEAGEMTPQGPWVEMG
ncbi:MAG: DUF1684 domain-containing protein [Anaerolineae bacterium]